MSMDASLYTAMAEAVDGELTPIERSQLSEDVFSRVIRVCHEAAVKAGAHRFQVRVTPVLQPPRMRFTKAQGVNAGDYLWMPDGRFGAVEARARTGSVFTFYLMDGEQVTASAESMIKVCESAAEAQTWNTQWYGLALADRQRIIDAYGYKSVVL